MRDTDTMATERIPDGWPPPTPVEILRVSRSLTLIALVALAANVLAIAWLAWEVRTAHGRGQAVQLTEERR